MTSIRTQHETEPSSLGLSPIVDTRRGFYLRYGKRMFDVTVSSIVLAILSPFVLIVALLARLQIGSPVLYSQIRLGLHGQEFVMLKFRSMLPSRRVTALPIGHEDRRGTHKSVKDPRHTKFGRVIRKSSIDEIPQLFNVLKGDMSLVGPRPELPEIAEKHDLVNHVRHNVRPGLTGLWQISGDRPGFVHENVQYDVQYVNTVSFRGDIKIILKTIPVLVRCGGL